MKNIHVHVYNHRGDIYVTYSCYSVVHNESMYTRWQWLIWSDRNDNHRCLGVHSTSGGYISSHYCACDLCLNTTSNYALATPVSDIYTP